MSSTLEKFSFLSTIPKQEFDYETKINVSNFQSYAGKVEGELEISLPENLRALYMVPFSASEAAKVLRLQKLVPSNYQKNL